MSVQLPEGTVIVEYIIGSVISAVYYPYRKSPDAYMVMNDVDFIHCVQCGEDFAKEQDAWISHIRRHDRRKKVQALA